MNPHQAKKVDIKSLSPEEQRLFRLYGKLPSKSDHFAKHLKERKYFDSGDYAMSKAGKGDSVDTGAVGSQHPVPENIPHLSSPISGTNGFNLLHPQQHHSNLQAGSPVKESSFLNRETSAEDLDTGAQKDENKAQGSQGSSDNTPLASPPAPAEGLPIRR